MKINFKQTKNRHRKINVGDQIQNLSTRKMCDRPFMSTHILSTGEVICHCLPELWYDEGGNRIMSMGNIKDFDNFQDLWNGEKYNDLRRFFKDEKKNKYEKICSRCPLSYDVSVGKNSFENSSEIFQALNKSPMPRHIQLEITTNCVYQCATCHRQIDPEKTRARGNMGDEVFKKVLESLNSDVHRITLFGQGESLSHPKAYDIIKSIKEKSPFTFLDICTTMWYANTEDKIKKLLTCGIDRIEMSLYATNDDEFYEYYRMRGFDRVLGNLKTTCDMKKNMGLEKPELIWKYILFKWNDSDESIDNLYEKSQNLNVPVMFTTTVHPEGAPSKKYVQGSENLKNLISRFNADHLKSYIQ